jgi:hypothetical protein
MKFLLGQTAKDIITGFTGVVTARAEYISGCHQILLAPPIDEKGSHRESHWYDEQRCNRVGEDMLTLDNDKTPGFDKSAPKR